MIDQLHAFPDQKTAEAVFPRPEGAEQAPCWLYNGATIMPVRIMLEGPEGPVAHPSYWVGLSVPDNFPALETFWSIPSAQVELERAEGDFVFWLSCIRRARLDLAAAVNVVGVTPLFAGSNYSFKV